MTDEVVDRVHNARAELIKKYGGFDGWVRHLIAKGRRRENAQERAAKSLGKKRRPQGVRSK